MPHTPLEGFCDAARVAELKRLLLSLLSLRHSRRFFFLLPLFLFSLKRHLIISGILIAERSEWDAEPAMTNAVAKVTERVSQGTWDGGAAEASCGLVIAGLGSAGANTPLAVSQQPDSSGTGGHLRPELFRMQRLLTPARLKVIYIRAAPRWLWMCSGFQTAFTYSIYGTEGGTECMSGFKACSGSEGLS